MSAAQNLDILLYVSRGRGRGHAMQDIAIADAIRADAPGMHILFASYDIGAKVLHQAGMEVRDLSLPEKNPFPETLLRIGHLIEEVKPSLVVAHEELAALTAARLLHVPALFLTHWFPPIRSPFSQALDHAHTVLYLEHRGIFPVQPPLRTQVEYLGPLVRPLSYSLDQKEELRLRFGIDTNATLAVVLPGSSPEEMTPIFSRVCEAFAELAVPSKQMIWVAGRDQALLSVRPKPHFPIKIITCASDVTALMVMSDLVITKGTYNTLCELASLGVPSITLSHGYNFVDDVYAKTRPRNRFICMSETDTANLVEIMNDIVGNQTQCCQSDLLRGIAPAVVAGKILSYRSLLAG